jgi:cell division transport system permease protein
VFTQWQDAAEFSVYLDDTVTREERAAVEQTLRQSRVVSALEAVSKEDALKRFRQNFATLAEAAGGLPANPLPASLEVRLRPDANPTEVAALADQAATLAGVADVRYDRQWIQRLMYAVDVVRAGGFTLAALLVFAATLTVASVVRLALVARREEIHIMQLVGAPIAYIRGPFIVEGLIQGGFGATAALIVLWIALSVVRSRADAWLAGAIDPASLVFLPLSIVAVLLAAGAAVGALGGFIAARGAREIAE